jgi:hypothetical protein
MSMLYKRKKKSYPYLIHSQDPTAAKKNVNVSLQLASIVLAKTMAHVHQTKRQRHMDNNLTARAQAAYTAADVFLRINNDHTHLQKSVPALGVR